MTRTTYVPVSGRVRVFSALAPKATTVAPDGANTVANAVCPSLKGLNPPVFASERSTVAPIVPLNVKRSTWAAAPMVPHTRSPQPRAPPVTHGMVVVVVDGVVMLVLVVVGGAVVVVVVGGRVVVVVGDAVVVVVEVVVVGA